MGDSTEFDYSTAMGDAPFPDTEIDWITLQRNAKEIEQFNLTHGNSLLSFDDENLWTSSNWGTRDEVTDVQSRCTQNAIGRLVSQKI